MRRGVLSLSVVRRRGRGWARTPARRRRSRDTSSSSRRSKGSVGRTNAESYKGIDPRYVKLIFENINQILGEQPKPEARIYSLRST